MGVVTRPLLTAALLLLILVTAQAPLLALAEANGATIEEVAFCDDDAGAAGTAAAGSAADAAASSPPKCRLRQPSPTDRVGPSLLYRTSRAAASVGASSANVIFGARRLLGYHQSEQNLCVRRPPIQLFHSRLSRPRGPGGLPRPEEEIDISFIVFL